jgi:hypothetical protein
MRERRVSLSRLPPGFCPASRGSAAIEFAITYAAVLLPLTFGLTFTSQLLWVWHSVNDFTRQGAGYAATHCWQSSAGNVMDFMNANVPPLIGQNQFQFGPARINVTYSSLDSASGQLIPFSCDSECSLACVPDTVTVSVTDYQFNSFVSFLGLPPITIPNFQTSQPMESAGCDPEQLVCLP